MRIFVSAVTSEFGKARDALRSDLSARGHEVVVQSDFQQSPDSETLLGTLAEYIRDCHAVICVVGKRAGASPPARAADRLKDALPQGVAYASYTQWEFFLARHYKRRPYVYLAKDDYAPDRDATRDDTALQDTYVAHLKAEGAHYAAFSTAEELRIAVMRDEPKIAVAPAAPPRQATKPIVLPYPSLGSLFKGRGDFMRELHARLTSLDGRTVVIEKPKAFYGLGGIGKTRAAVEYAWAHQDDYTALLFVVAETPEALRANLVALTNSLAPPLKEAPDDIRLAAVLDWLRANPGWLLILDNVDSKDAIAAVEQRLQDLQGGQVLVTSRLSDFSGNFAPLPLDVLSLDDAVAFLLERTDGRRRNAADDTVQAKEIARELDGLALALEQAGAYIAKRRLTLGGYLEQWRSASRDQVLDWFDETVTGYKRAVAVTWQTSVAQLTDPGRHLLERLAWFAPEKIPEFLLDTPIPSIEHEDLHDALADLVSYSLVTHDTQTPFFLVHRLVQDVTRRSLVPEKRQRRLSETLRWIDAVFPDDLDDLSTWPRAEALASHVRDITTNADKFDIGDPTAGLMDRLGRLLRSKAQYSEAESLLQRSLAINEHILGKDHPLVASSLNNLAIVYQAQGRYPEAELLYRRSIKIIEETLGAEHSELGGLMSNLAALYRAEGRYLEAEPLYRRSLTIFEQTREPNHQDVGASLNNLATLYRAQERYAEAEPLYKRSLEIHTKNHGPEHPRVATSLNNLASVYRGQGRFSEAEPLYQRALAIREKALGPFHDEVANSLNSISLIYLDQGSLEKAKSSMLRCIRILILISRQMSREHPYLQLVVNNYVDVLTKMGHNREEIDSELQKLKTETIES